MPTQLDRIEATQKKILEGLKLKEQLDRIESGMAEIAAKQTVGMTPEQEAVVDEVTDRLTKQAAEFDDAANEQSK